MKKRCYNSSYGVFHSARFTGSASTVRLQIVAIILGTFCKAISIINADHAFVGWNNMDRSKVIEERRQSVLSVASCLSLITVQGTLIHFVQKAERETTRMQRNAYCLFSLFARFRATRPLHFPLRFDWPALLYNRKPTGAL